MTKARQKTACTKMFDDASHALNKLSRSLALLESENASLRGAVEGLGGSNDRYKAENQRLIVENARLRELCKYMKISLCEADPVDNPCDLCGGWDSGLNDCAYELQMRELGIEVE